MVNEIKINGTQNFMGYNLPIIEGGFGEKCKCITVNTIADIHGARIDKITAIPLEIKTSSLIKIFHSCVVVLDGRQPACVLRLAVKIFYSAPFISISSGIAVMN